MAIAGVLSYRCDSVHCSLSACFRVARNISVFTSHQREVAGDDVNSTVRMLYECGRFREIREMWQIVESATC